MTFSGAICLVSLAAIWGSSFLFMRVGVPALGPVILIELRVALAALLLLFAGWYLKRKLATACHWKQYLIIGLFNSALPFLLFAFAAQTLTASLLSILNATAPIWGAVIGAVWHRTALSISLIAGLVFGVIGVSILVGLDHHIFLQEGASLAVIAALGAAGCYGVASVYAQSFTHISPFDSAHGSLWAATLLILPLVPFYPMHEPANYTIIQAVLMLGLLCTGVAYLLYFHLIANLGAASALSVAFLIPVFGVIWGHLFLDEVIGWHTILGALFVVMGTAMVTGAWKKLPVFAKVVSDD